MQIVIGLFKLGSDMYSFFTLNVSLVRLQQGHLIGASGWFSPEPAFSKCTTALAQYPGMLREALPIQAASCCTFVTLPHVGRLPLLAASPRVLVLDRRGDIALLPRQPISTYWGGGKPKEALGPPQ